MGDIILNNALGRIVELANRVNNNDPANSVFLVVPFSGTETDANLKDVDTLAQVEATALAELTANGWSRKTIDNTGGITVTVTDASDKVEVDIPNQTWTTVTAGTATRVAIAYDSDSTGGADSAIEVLAILDMAVVPSGGDITLNINASGIFRAT